MKTDQLIAVLAADVRQPAKPQRALPIAALAGGAVTLVLFLAVLGVRPDIGDALLTWRFDVKLAVVFVALVTALFDGVRLMRPTTPPLHPALLALPMLLLLPAVIAELALLPTERWLESLVGSNGVVCLVAIPLLAAMPLAAALAAMRLGAPRSPTVAGAAAGRLAAAIGAALYALHCFDDSPLFIATWYTLATLFVIAIGALLGRLTLRW